MRNDYIYEQVNKLAAKYKARDPFELLGYLNVDAAEMDGLKKLKGFCFYSCQTFYVRFSSSLFDAEKRIVAAHELGHIVLHRKELQMAPMNDSVLYDMTSVREYEANLFAADLLIEDRDVEQMSQDPELNYFSMCGSLCVSPELMSFKLYSMIRRGYPYNMPLEIKSTFLRQ